MPSGNRRECRARVASPPAHLQIEYPHVLHTAGLLGVAGWPPCASVRPAAVSPLNGQASITLALWLGRPAPPEPLQKSRKKAHALTRI